MLILEEKLLLPCTHIHRHIKSSFNQQRISRQHAKQYQPIQKSWPRQYTCIHAHTACELYYYVQCCRYVSHMSLVLTWLTSSPKSTWLRVILTLALVFDRSGSWEEVEGGVLSFDECSHTHLITCTLLLSSWPSNATLYCTLHRNLIIRHSEMRHLNKHDTLCDKCVLSTPWNWECLDCM